jgi:hypothetical protein
VSKVSSEAFANLLPLRDRHALRPPAVWAVTEARIDGDDLMKMEFSASLANRTKQHALWSSIRTRQTEAELLVMGFSIPREVERYDSRF